MGYGLGGHPADRLLLIEHPPFRPDVRGWEMRPWGAVDTPADRASLSHLTSICALAVRPGLSSVGEPGAGLLGSGAVAVTLPELERALQFGARLA